MSECLVSSSASHPAIAPRLCYSNFMGIKNSSVFKCIDCIQDNYVLIYVTRGQLYCEQEKHSFALIEGEYLLLDKSIMHSYYFKDEEPSEIYWIHINGKLAKKLIAEIDVISPIPFVGKNPKILADLEECIVSHREQRDDPFEHSARLLAMLHTVLEDAYNRQKETQYSSKEFAFRSRFENIVEHDTKDLTLDYLCAKMDMSKYYFSHLFKQYYKISPIKYIIKAKLDRSKQFLRHTDMKIATISKECGFSSAAHFTSSFQKEFGITPGEYRSRGKISE